MVLSNVKSYGTLGLMGIHCASERWDFPLLVSKFFIAKPRGARHDALTNMIAVTLNLTVAERSGRVIF